MGVEIQGYTAIGVAHQRLHGFHVLALFGQLGREGGSEHFREMVGFMARFRNYAPDNNMLARFAKPNLQLSRLVKLTGSYADAQTQLRARFDSPQGWQMPRVWKLRLLAALIWRFVVEFCILPITDLSWPLKDLALANRLSRRSR
jgi:hypothetical protein